MGNNFYNLKILLEHIKEIEDKEITEETSNVLNKLYNQLIIESSKIYGTTDVYM